MYCDLYNLGAYNVCSVCMYHRYRSKYCMLLKCCRVSEKNK